MTYALAWPLQQAVRARLAADPGVVAVLGDRIWDAPPQETHLAPPDTPYAVIGDERAGDWSTATDRGAEHVLRVSVHAASAGFAAAKAAAGAICDALLGADLGLARGHVVYAGFLDAETRRSEDGRLRTIRMRFRLLIEDTA